MGDASPPTTSLPAQVHDCRGPGPPVVGYVAYQEGQPLPPVVSGTILRDIPLPVMPLYDLKVAAPLIPISHTGLIEFLSRHRSEYKAVYRMGTNRRRHRLLSAREIVRIRATVLRGPGLPDALAMYPEGV